jgi:hypothetical protein
MVQGHKVSCMLPTSEVHSRDFHGPRTQPILQDGRRDYPVLVGSVRCVRKSSGRPAVWHRRRFCGTRARRFGLLSLFSSRLCRKAQAELWCDFRTELASGMDADRMGCGIGVGCRERNRVHSGYCESAAARSFGLLSIVWKVLAGRLAILCQLRRSHRLAVSFILRNREESQ